MPAPRRVLVLAGDGLQALDAVGPIEVLSTACAVAEAPEYETALVAPGDRGVVATSSGLDVVASPLPEVAPADTLVVAGGAWTRSEQLTLELLWWVRDQAAVSRRVTSVCTGAFVLAAAGLLDGRRATTHWAWCRSLARRHPGVEVVPDPIFVRDGDVWTSAGVTAGMDLALALVEDDLGPAVALSVARALVLFLKRPGDQAQFSTTLAAQTASRGPVRELQAWIGDHLDEDLSVPVLAARVGRSERQLTRLFGTETGMSPAAYVEALRVERARALLTSSPLGVESIAREVGLGSGEVLRRAFHRRLGVSPSEVRERFSRAA
ncbi:GlxA family transcriptional regulator [Conexibacter sp. SYSU D00693]|uniref:GlxA family transcriptional regulator n=1 Tax=Conexibacter sp. SYSU D00693 TaxID=2812560 RepID=UPI00196B985A|nr:GlxA family transcriptional regulator [Conexibacter sp. SYSU D00693]